jgi:predicted nucleic acid-binding protein
VSGKAYLLDTNAVIALFRGHGDLQETLAKAQWVGISIITLLEFLSFKGLSLEDQELIQEFKGCVHLIDVESADVAMVNEIVRLRKTANLKLPDAIIAAAALRNNAVLVTEDQDFCSVTDLAVLGIKV